MSLMWSLVGIGRRLERKLMYLSACMWHVALLIFDEMHCSHLYEYSCREGCFGLVLWLLHED